MRSVSNCTVNVITCEFWVYKVIWKLNSIEWSLCREQREQRQVSRLSSDIQSQTLWTYLGLRPRPSQLLEFCFCNNTFRGHVHLRRGVERERWDTLQTWQKLSPIETFRIKVRPTVKSSSRMEIRWCCHKRIYYQQKAVRERTETGEITSSVI